VLPDPCLGDPPAPLSRGSSGVEAPSGAGMGAAAEPKGTASTVWRHQAQRHTRRQLLVSSALT